MVLGSLSGARAEEPPAAPPAERPLAASVDRLLKRLEAERKSPCPRPSEDKNAVPCFPVSVEEAESREFSVADDLRRYKPDGSRTPGGPATMEDLRPFRPGPKGPFAGFGFDPVCTTKSILTALKGKNNTYYLYRIKDRAGEQAALRDAPLDPATYASRPDVSFELVGKFTGECDALAAYRHEQLKLSPSPSLLDRPAGSAAAKPTGP